MTRRFDQILYKKKKSFGEKILLSPLFLASLPYGWAVRVRTYFYSMGLLKTRKLPRPVISIGNITVGGTGKTPLVMSLAKGLMERGIRVAILSRGYQGKGGVNPLVTDGEKVLLSPQEAGDEPFLMAQVLKGVPVLVGKDRFKNGLWALKQFPLDGFLLDDGFQHLFLDRDLNIVLIDSQTGFGDGHLLPRGILREPLSHLKRADLFLLTKMEDPAICPFLETMLNRMKPSAPIFHSYYEPSGLINPDGQIHPLSRFKGKRILALSGIAHPAYFSTLLKQCGLEVVREMTFPDHHRYTDRDLTILAEEVKKIEWIVTTEKDLVKLKTLPIDALPLYALRIDVRIEEEEAFYEKVMNVFKI